MRDALKKRRVRIISAIVMIPVAVVLGFGLYLANLAGELPWQTDPTRIPVVAFEGLQTGPKIATRAATPKAGTSASPVASSSVRSPGTPVATPTT
jgi:hypothetical protein